MTLRVADFYASCQARRHLRAARHFRAASAIAASAGAHHAAVLRIRELMRANGVAAVAAARRTKAMLAHPDSEIGEVCDATA